MALKQKERLLSLTTPLGPDTLLLVAFTGREELSRLFSYRLEMISDSSAISPANIVGKGVTWSVKLRDETPRYFHGVVSRFSAGDEQHGRRNYRAEVVPWLWFLTRTADCRIFQNKTVKEIIEQIFGDLGFSDFETSQVKGSHPKRDYCVQYRETDFDFVSRLMEEEGIFYFFKHEHGKHQLVLGDQKGAYVDCREKEVDYPTDFGSRAVEDFLTSWEHRYQFRTGKWAQTDYNFETPSTRLMTNVKSLVPLPGIDKFEVYDYPGAYGQSGDGNALTKLRMEAEEAAYDVVEGTSLCKSFTPGGKFKVRQHRSPSEEKKTYVVTAVEHRAAEPTSYETGESSGQEWDYSNRFTCIPESVTFRPERSTRRPVVHGVQTAVVVGPAGEEIYTDKYGRVKVQFPWDREGKRDEHSSCWVRVAQDLAGKNWGIVFHPRIGQEVIVDFLEGDPDRPIITGRVYNAEQMPPYELPGQQTRSTIKTNSSKGGTGYNEIRFDDLKDKEQVFIHAQKDLDLRVQNDARESVLHDRHETVNRNHTEHIGGDMQLLVGGIDGAGNQDIVIKADKKERIEANQHLHVKVDRHEQVDGNQSLTVGVNQQEKVGQRHALEAGQEIHLKGGMTVVIEAGMQLTIKGPGGFVDIGPAGVTIQGVLVNINSGGAAGAGSGSSPTAPTDAQEAKPAAADDSQTGHRSAP